MLSETRYNSIYFSWIQPQEAKKKKKTCSGFHIVFSAEHFGHGQTDVLSNCHTSCRIKQWLPLCANLEYNPPTEICTSK